MVQASGSISHHFTHGTLTLYMDLPLCQHADWIHISSKDHKFNMLLVSVFPWQ